MPITENEAGNAALTIDDTRPESDTPTDFTVDREEQEEGEGEEEEEGEEGTRAAESSGETKKHGTTVPETTVKTEKVENEASQEEVKRKTRYGGDKGDTEEIEEDKENEENEENEEDEEKEENEENESTNKGDDRNKVNQYQPYCEAQPQTGPLSKTSVPLHSKTRKKHVKSLGKPPSAPKDKDDKTYSRHKLWKPSQTVKDAKSQKVRKKGSDLSSTEESITQKVEEKDDPTKGMKTFPKDPDEPSSKPSSDNVTDEKTPSDQELNSSRQKSSEIKSSVAQESLAPSDSKKKKKEKKRGSGEDASQRKSDEKSDMKGSVDQSQTTNQSKLSKSSSKKDTDSETRSVVSSGGSTRSVVQSSASSRNKSNDMPEDRAYTDSQASIKDKEPQAESLKDEKQPSKQFEKEQQQNYKNAKSKPSTERSPKEGRREKSEDHRNSKTLGYQRSYESPRKRERGRSRYTSSSPRRKHRDRNDDHGRNKGDRTMEYYHDMLLSDPDHGVDRRRSRHSRSRSRSRSQNSPRSSSRSRHDRHRHRRHHRHRSKSRSGRGGTYDSKEYGHNTSGSSRDRHYRDDQRQQRLLENPEPYLTSTKYMQSANYGGTFGNTSSLNTSSQGLGEENLTIDDKTVLLGPELTCEVPLHPENLLCNEQPCPLAHYFETHKACLTRTEVYPAGLRRHCESLGIELENNSHARDPKISKFYLPAPYHSRIVCALPTYTLVTGHWGANEIPGQLRYYR